MYLSSSLCLIIKLNNQSTDAKEGINVLELHRSPITDRSLIAACWFICFYQFVCCSISPDSQTRDTGIQTLPLLNINFDF